MMKWGFALNAGLGALLVVSSLGSGQGGDGGLELTLQRTTRGLEELVGLQKRLESGDRAAVDELLRVTDPAGNNPVEDEARLTALRLEVARLRMVHDGLAPLDSVQLPSTDERASTRTAAGPTTHGTTRPGSAGGARKSSTNGDGKNVDDGLTAFEPAGFSADPVLQGEALFRAARYEECLAALRKAPDDPRGQYWTGRTLELLGRVDEALDTYRKLSARKDGGWAAQRAKSDLEFLEWKRSTTPGLEGRADTGANRPATTTPAGGAPASTPNTNAPAPAPANRTLVPTKGPSLP